MVVDKTKKNYLVAVYGTLRKGQRFFLSALSQPLLERKIEFLTTMDTAPNFTMYDLGTYPALVEEGETSIKVEVYRVNKEVLTHLDRIEGYEGENSEHNLYNRSTLDTPFGKAIIYVFNKKKGSWLAEQLIIKGGDWVEHFKTIKVL